MKWINLEVEHKIAILTLNRAKVNAQSPELLDELAEAFLAVSRDEGVRGVLLQSALRAFSAGLDLKAAMGLGADAIPTVLSALERCYGAAFRCPKPVAVAVEGHAIAGGLVLALAGDYLALADGAYKVGLTELAVGIPLPRVAFEIVSQPLPPKALRTLYYGAELHSPQEAFAMGVGDVLTDDPRQAARAWLDKVCARPLRQFQIAKRQVRAEAWDRIRDASEGEMKEILDAINSPETFEAMAAYFTAGRK